MKQIEILKKTSKQIVLIRATQHTFIESQTQTSISVTPFFNHLF